MRKFLYIMLLILTFLMFYLCLSIDISQTSNKYSLAKNKDQIIASNIIEKDGLLRIQILDKKYYSSLKQLPFITVSEKGDIFVNEGSPIKLFDNLFIFSNSSKKLVYINKVIAKKDTIVFTGFNFANLNLGTENDTFKIYKIME